MICATDEMWDSDNTCLYIVRGCWGRICEYEWHDVMWRDREKEGHHVISAINCVQCCAMATLDAVYCRRRYTTFVLSPFLSFSPHDFISPYLYIHSPVITLIGQRPIVRQSQSIFHNSYIANYVLMQFHSQGRISPSTYEYLLERVYFKHLTYYTYIIVY